MLSGFESQLCNYHNSNTSFEAGGIENNMSTRKGL